MAEPAASLVAEELRTPPLGLVALLGRSDLHPALGEHLRNELRPPLNSVGTGEVSQASRVIGVRSRHRIAAGAPSDPNAAAALAAAAAGAAANSHPLAAPPLSHPLASSTNASPAKPQQQQQGSAAASNGEGLLRVGWLQKHRQRRPAVALVFIAQEAAEGDPSAWMALSKQLDAVRVAAAAGGARLAIVVVGDDVPDQLPEDRAARGAGISH